MRKQLFALLLAPLAACNFTTFDDLKDDVAVIALDNPTEKATDFGVALQRGQRVGTEGGSLVILGNNRIAYTRYEIGADGTIDRSANVDAQTLLGAPQQYQVSSLLVADPGSDTVALITPTQAAGQVGVYENPGAAILDGSPLDSVPNLVGGAYVNAITTPGEALTGTHHVLVAGSSNSTSSFVLRQRRGDGEAASPPCVLKKTGGTDDVSIRALGGQYVTSTTQHDIVTLTSAGEILVYPSTVALGGTDATGCPGGMAEPIVGKAVGQLSLGFAPGAGSRILPLGDGHVVVAAIEENNGNGSFIGVVAVGDGTSAPTLVGVSKTDPKLRSVSLLPSTEVSGAQGLLAAGYPETTVAGEAAAGEIWIYPVSETGGVMDPVSVVSRAQPDGSDRLGRAVALIDYNGGPLLAAGGNDNAYIFFRAAGLYDDDRRQGRSGN